MRPSLTFFTTQIVYVDRELDRAWWIELYCTVSGAGMRLSCSISSRALRTKHISYDTFQYTLLLRHQMLKCVKDRNNRKECIFLLVFASISLPETVKTGR